MVGEIPIALKMPEKGETKAQSGKIACFRHLTSYCSHRIGLQPGV
jgi:hypothetical protein